MMVQKYGHTCNVCAITMCINMCKMYVTFLFLLGANVTNFTLFARCECEWCGICVIRCIFLVFTGITSRSLAMGVDFTRTVCKMHEIGAIRSNFLEFSAGGQESEST